MKLKISISFIIEMIMLLAIFPPQAIVNIGIIAILLNVVQILMFLYFMFCFFKEKDILVLLSCAYAMVVSISSLIHGINFNQSLIQVLDLVGFMLYLNHGMRFKPQKLICNLSIYFSAISVINYIYLVYYHYFQGKAADDTYFITVPNTITSIFLFATLLIIIRCYITFDKISTFSLITIFCIAHTELILWSATGLMGYSILIIFLAFFYNKKRERIWNLNILSIVSIALFFAITIFRLQEKFAFLIEGVLKKDLTFTGRTVLWDFYMIKITESPLLGYGYGYKPYKGGLFAHSGYLEIMIQGGLILAFLVIGVYLYATRKLKYFKGESVVYLITCAIFSIEIMMLTERAHPVILFGIFMFAHKIDLLVEMRKAKSCL